MDVASHWPFIERNLVLTRWGSASLALGALASLQVESQGEPAYLGAARLRAGGLTDGEARNVIRTLTELSERDVVIRHPGRGRRSSAWSFRPDLTNWRRMPWVWGALAVESALGACVCRASSGFDARNPGQRGALTRGKAVFRLSAADHLQRPGLFPVDTRVESGARATNPKGRAWDPVDTRVKSEAPGTPLLSSENYVLRTSDVNDEDRNLDALRGAIRATTGGEVFGSPLVRLAALAAEAGDGADSLAALFVDRCSNLRSPPAAVDAMVQLWRSGARPAPTPEPIEVRITRQEIDRLEGQLAAAARVGEPPDAFTEAELEDLRRRLAGLIAA